VFRRLVLRALGLAVAAIVLVVATQLLMLSFDADPLVSRETVDDLVDWIGGDPSDGAAILVGVALLALAVWLGWMAVSSAGTEQHVITTRRRNGWTKIDRRTLGDSLERRLDSVDRRSDVAVRVRRGGRVDLEVVTPDPSITGSPRELRDSLNDIVTARNLPCRSGRLTATVPRRMTGRRRVR